jgi:HD-GYP domain-containing protein (c-di-GMP phosphodiesterase class II)
MKAFSRPIAATGTRRLVAMAGLACALVTTGLALVRPSVLARQDYRVYDWLIRATPASQPSETIAIVDVDDQSLAAVGQWPWRRSVLAQLIDSIRDGGAAAVVLDVLMAEPDRFEESADTALADAIGRGRVVLGYAMTFAGDSRASETCASRPLAIVVTQSDAATDGVPLFRATGSICNLTPLERAAKASGFLNAVPDADGILRRVPLIMVQDGRMYPSLALAAVMSTTGAEARALRLRSGAGSLTLGDQIVPVDDRGNMLLRYRGRKDAFPHVSARDVLQHRTPHTAFQGKLVFIGATALGVRDAVTTPLDTLVAGVDVQASAAEDLLQRDFVSRPDEAVAFEVMAVLVATLAATVAASRRGLAWAAGVSVFAVVLLWSGAWWVFTTRGLFVSPLLPTLAAALTFMAMMVTAFTAERGRADTATTELDRSQRLVVQSLLSLTEARDADTARHSTRIQAYTRMLASQLSSHPRFHTYLTPERIELLASLAPLHDIGKVGIRDSVLTKPGALTADEFDEIKKHPMLGRDVLQRAEREVGSRNDPTLRMAKEIVYTHHERWDGLGYPEGLHGEEIPIPGRVVAVVDFLDALVTKRVYRDRLPFEEAVDLIVARRGTHFDPAVVDAFLNISGALQRAVLTEHA